MSARRILATERAEYQQGRHLVAILGGSGPGITIKIRRVRDKPPACPECGGELERERCGQCDGTGWIDDEQLMQEDPLWYQPGDTERCSECGGKGGWWYCPQASSHPPQYATGDDDPGLRVAPL